MSNDFQVKMQDFNVACDEVRYLLRMFRNDDTYGVSTAISEVAPKIASIGNWDIDDLIIELNCMGYADCDSYND